MKKIKTAHPILLYCRGVANYHKDAEIEIAEDTVLDVEQEHGDDFGEVSSVTASMDIVKGVKVRLFLRRHSFEEVG